MSVGAEGGIVLAFSFFKVYPQLNPPWRIDRFCCVYIIRINTIFDYFLRGSDKMRGFLFFVFLVF